MVWIPGCELIVTRDVAYMDRAYGTFAVWGAFQAHGYPDGIALRKPWVTISAARNRAGFWDGLRLNANGSIG